MFCAIIQAAKYIFLPHNCLLLDAIDNNRHRCCACSIDFWPARNSRLTQRETNHYITRCASELAWPYLAGGSPGQSVIDLFAQHQWFSVCCQSIYYIFLPMSFLLQGFEKNCLITKTQNCQQSYSLRWKILHYFLCFYEAFLVSCEVFSSFAHWSTMCDHILHILTILTLWILI